MSDWLSLRTSRALRCLLAKVDTHLYAQFIREIEAVAWRNRLIRAKAWGDASGTRLGMTTERSK